MHTNYQLNQFSRKEGYNKMIGEVEKLYSYNTDDKEEYKLIIPIMFWFCKYKLINLPILSLMNSKIYFNIEVKELKHIVKTNPNIAVEFADLDNFNLKLVCDYIYMDDVLRQKYITTRNDQLIEQHSFQNYIISDPNNISIDFHLKGNIKDICWVIIEVNNNYAKEPFNYSQSSTDYLNGKNTIKKTSMILNGKHRFKNLEGMFTNYIIPREKYGSTPSDGINIYSFAEYPEQLQPSGTCNFNSVKSGVLKVILEDDYLNYIVNNNIRINLVVMSRSYNVLRIMSGLGGLVNNMKI